MFVRFYTYEPLKASIRGSFELPAFPYNGNPKHYALFEKYLLDLNIFWYEDNISQWPKGVKRGPIINLTRDLGDKFICLHHSCYIDDNILKIVNFPQSMINSDKSVQLTVERNNDSFAWKDFNIVGDISKIDPSGMHVFEKRYEYLMSCETECNKEEKPRIKLA